MGPLSDGWQRSAKDGGGFADSANNQDSSCTASSRLIAVSSVISCPTAHGLADTAALPRLSKIPFCVTDGLAVFQTCSVTSV